MAKLALCILVLAVYTFPQTSSSAIVADKACCFNLNAGLRYCNDLYLFSGHHYLQFIDGGNETYEGKLDEWGDIGGPIDAAVQWSGNHHYYLFKGTYYYIFVPVFGLFGPKSLGENWGEFFQHGIDAAGNLFEKTYFFKGCHFVIWDSVVSGQSQQQTIPRELPCDIDAAWDYGGDYETLAIAKGDKMWIWGSSIEGPFNVSSEYDISPWNLCPYMWTPR